MPALAVSVFALSVVVFVALKAWLDRWRVSAPMVFTLVGGLSAAAEAHAGLSAEALQALTQTTLALILFHDAAQVRPAQLRRDASLSARLLCIGLPLTVLLGYLTARLLAPAGTAWAALFLAAALAPTDAGLGAATVLNPVVPVRVRRVLSVESGLNDGLVTPVVLLAVAGMGAAEPAQEPSALPVVEELVVGAAVGVLAGAAVGTVLEAARRRGLASGTWIPLGVLMVPLLAYGVATTAHANGFIAAFLSGTAFAAAHAPRGREAVETVPGTPEVAPAAPDAVPAVSRTTDAPDAATGTAPASVIAGATDDGDDGDGDGDVHLSDSVSTLLGYAVWTAFGLEALPHLWNWFTWRGLVLAGLSLTLLRMVPVAVALVGTGLRPATVLFIGWFGPRGLASVIFALIALRSVSSSGLAPILAVVELTVLLSVILHGTTAGPWARRYGAWARRTRPATETQG